MLAEEAAVTAVGRVIELAIAPVFLLSAIGSLLIVLTNRLSRIIDRARVLEVLLVNADETTIGRVVGELATLTQRGMVIHRAITLSISTAVLICSLVVVLFLGAFLEVDFSILIALLFIGAMLSFLGGLLTLMRELFLATSALRFGKR